MEVIQEKVSYDIPPELQAVIPGYLERRDQDITQLKAANAQHDFLAMGKIAHKLKGNGASYGFEYLTEIGRHLMAACETKNQLEIDQLIFAFETEVKKIKINIL